jgi:ureidoacrylate peracid hydrolase
MNDITADQVQPETTAVVVIDMQNDYVHRDGAVIRYFRENHGSQAGANGPTHAEVMVPALLRLIAGARAAKVQVVWVVTHQHPWTVTPYWQTRWETAETNTQWGRALYAGLEPGPGEPMVIKRRHSCFFATDMDLILRRLQITTVAMTGVGTPYCVEGSVRDAFMLDYNTITVSDATATREWSEHEAALRRLGTAFGRVTDSETLLRAWTPAAQPA